MFKTFSIAAALCLVACGGEVPFVEPNPPQTRFLDMTFEHRAEDEPVVIGLIFDLEIPDPIECRSTQQMLQAFAQTLLDENQGRGRVLAAVDLAPGCAQAAGRRLSHETISAEVNAARDAFGPERVRPVFVYANNVTWPLSFELQGDLTALSGYGPAADRPALLLALSTPEVTVGAVETVTWTFAADPRLREALDAAARRYLPFRTRHPMAAQPLFDSETQRAVLGFRWCNPQSWIQPINFATGMTSSVSPAQPPALLSSLAPVYMERRELLFTSQSAIRVEICTAHCERFAQTPEGLRRWNTLRTCLPAPDPEVTP